MKPSPTDLERVLAEHQYPPAARALIEAEVRRLRAPPAPSALSPELQAVVDALDNAAARAVPEVTGAAMHVPMALWVALVEARAALPEPR